MTLPSLQTEIENLMGDKQVFYLKKLSTAKIVERR